MSRHVPPQSGADSTASAPSAELSWVATFSYRLRAAPRVFRPYGIAQRLRHVGDSGCVTISSIQMKQLIFFPTYNEFGNVASMLARIFQAVPEADILIVDDNSGDGTQDMLASCRKDKVTSLV